MRSAPEIVADALIGKEKLPRVSRVLFAQGFLKTSSVLFVPCEMIVASVLRSRLRKGGTMQPGKHTQARPSIFPPVVMALAAAAMLLSPSPASSQALLGLHEKMRVHGKLCLATHRHTGHARARASKRQVANMAMRDWNGFTNLEYGHRWARFRHAHKRHVSCAPSGGGWSCNASALPCRR
ncbi:MAG: hypothetical protein AAGJ70_01570 [Pseudomonadota bacterium]